MPIIRANDPRENDTAHQIKKTLGMMCDAELSNETKQLCVEKLTKLMQGLPMTEETFRNIGINAKLIKTEKELTLHVHVPKEYVFSGIKENRNAQWIVFQINRALDIENLNNSDKALITDMTGKPIEPEEEKTNK